MNWITYGGLALTLAVVAASPGPGVFTVVSTSLFAGFRRAAAVVAGIVTGHLVFLVLAFFGLSMAAKALGGLFFWVKLAGGLYLIWLGLRIWRKEPTGGIVSQKKPVPKRSCLANWLTGLLVTLSNPKAIFFYCGVFPALMDLSRVNLLDLAVASAMVAVIFSLVLTGYGYAAARAKDGIYRHGGQKVVNRISGGVMMTAGVVMAAKS